ncbi:MAG: hypothetical protein NTU73_05185 [Ignavibacteriae bacterium]|nr:hypothetical protein [Ignavibacteriota bacterium]
MFKKIIILLIFVIGLNISLKAQEDTSMTGSRQKLKKVIKEKLMEKLNIDESTANKFFKLFNEQRKVTNEYNKDKRQLMKSIEENPDASDVMTKINELIEIDDKINKSRKEFIMDLQKAQSIIFQKNLRKLFLKDKGKQ